MGEKYRVQAPTSPAYAKWAFSCFSWMDDGGGFNDPRSYPTRVYETPDGVTIIYLFSSLKIPLGFTKRLTA